MTTDVIVKVRYCAINHLDILVRNGSTVRKIQFPHILGCDVCGTLEEGFGNFKIGDKVVIYPVINDGSSNLINIIGGFSAYNGGYAEFIRVPKQCIVKKPHYFSDKEACSLNISYLTAWNILESLDCKTGKCIFVWGAGSGIGSAIILLAKARGINVITVTSNDEKMKLSKKIGADVIINRNKKNILKSVTKYYSGGVDYVVDHVGAKTWPISIKLLKVGGKMATCGITTGCQTRINILDIYNKQLTIFGIYAGSKSQLMKLHSFMKNNKIKPVIDSTFSLENAVFAHKRMTSNNHFGKIILEI